MMEDSPAPPTFAALGVDEALCTVVDRLGWKAPTAVQAESLPPALEGRDVIGLAETGSGKTAAFVIPILQSLLTAPRPFTGLVVTPTRELAVQIKEQVRALGAAIGVRCVCLTGGARYMDQAVELGGSSPHVVIGTPGRLVDHLENTRGFELHLGRVKFLVLDEADRLLNMDFEVPLAKIVACCPKERTTLLFSATMTKKVEKLQRAHLRSPVRVEVSRKSRTVAGLSQHYVLVPHLKKDCALVHLFRTRLASRSAMVFVDTCQHSMRLALTLRYFGVTALPLNGRMAQNKRLAALNKFRAGAAACLVATDVASRGLDIPHVDAVVVYSVPGIKDYVHRVGRTARAGRRGEAISLVTQYDVQAFLMVEHALGTRVPALELPSAELAAILPEVREADAVVRKVMGEEKAASEATRGRRKGRSRFEEEDEDEDENEAGKGPGKGRAPPAKKKKRRK